MDNTENKINGTMWTITHRPQTLDKLYGQDQVGRFINGIKESGKEIPSIILFQGPTGTGKTTSAKILAKMIQCQHPNADGTPCGKCLSCQSIQNETYGRDTFVYDGASKTTKEEMEQFLTDVLSTPPIKDRNKVIIIEEYQQLGPKAQEVTLKYFEKPMNHTYFFLTAMSEIKSRAILSRCQKINFKKPNVMETMFYLKSILEDEGLWTDKSIPDDFKKEGLQTIALNADGSYRDALQILEQCLTSHAFTSKDMELYLNLVNYDNLDSDILKILTGKVDDDVRENLLNEFNSSQCFTKISHEVSRLAMKKAFTGTNSGFVSKYESMIINNPNFKLLSDGISEIMKDCGIMSGPNVIVFSDIYITKMCEIICECKGTPSVFHIMEQTNITVPVENKAVEPPKSVEREPIEVPKPVLGTRRVIRRG